VYLQNFSYDYAKDYGKYDVYPQPTIYPKESNRFLCINPPQPSEDDYEWNKGD